MKRPKKADHITIEPCHCGCDQVYVYLWDERGKAFAVAPFAKEGVRSVAADLVNAADELLVGGKAHGHA